MPDKDKRNERLDDIASDDDLLEDESLDIFNETIADTTDAIDVDAEDADVVESETEDSDMDSEETDEDNGDNDLSGSKTKIKKPKSNRTSIFTINPKETKLLHLSVIGAIIGMLVGFIPLTLITYIMGRVYYPLYVIIALMIYLFVRLFRGGRDIRTMIFASVLSLYAAYIARLACLAALYIRYYSLSFTKIPGLVLEAFGKRGTIPDVATSSFVYPLVFTLLGIVLAIELFRGRVSVLSESNQALDSVSFDDVDDIDDEFDDDADDDVVVDVEIVDDELGDDVDDVDDMDTDDL